MFIIEKECFTYTLYRPPSTNSFLYSWPQLSSRPRRCAARTVRFGTSVSLLLVFPYNRNYLAFISLLYILSSFNSVLLTVFWTYIFLYLTLASSDMSNDGGASTTRKGCHASSFEATWALIRLREDRLEELRRVQWNSSASTTPNRTGPSESVAEAQKGVEALNVRLSERETLRVAANWQKNTLRESGLCCNQSSEFCLFQYFFFS